MLKVHVQGAEPCPIGSRRDLVAAVEDAAEQIAVDAGSDLLAAPTEKERKQLRQRIVSSMLARLWQAGDEYRAPDGTRYSLEAKAADPIDNEYTGPCPDCGGAGIRSETEAAAVAMRDGVPVERARGYCATCEASGQLPPFGEH